MTQFFNHRQAEEVASEMENKFPQLLEVHVLDIHNKENGEYERSFVTFYYGNILADKFISHSFNSQKDVEMFLELCQYIASALSDNQQSEEEEEVQQVSFHPPHGPECMCNYCDPNQGEEINTYFRCGVHQNTGVSVRGNSYYCQECKGVPEIVIN